MREENVRLEKSLERREREEKIDIPVPAEMLDESLMSEEASEQSESDYSQGEESAGSSHEGEEFAEIR